MLSEGNLSIPIQTFWGKVFSKAKNSKHGAENVNLSFSSVTGIRSANSYIFQIVMRIKGGNEHNALEYRVLIYCQYAQLIAAILI